MSFFRSYFYEDNNEYQNINFVLNNYQKKKQFLKTEKICHYLIGY